MATYLNVDGDATRSKNEEELLEMYKKQEALSYWRLSESGE